MDTATRTPLTDATWDRYLMYGYGPENAGGWEVTADLAHELAECTHLPVEQARMLVGLCATGNPVVLEWDTPLPGGRIETTRTTVVVDRIHGPIAPSVPGVHGRIRVRYCGFGHNIHLDRIREVENVPCDRSYRDRDEA